jgi:hypothetical protein
VGAVLGQGALGLSEPSEAGGPPPVSGSAPHVFGVPGASIQYVAGFDQSVIEAGTYGERVVGAELERLAAKYPNVYVFHSMKLPGKIGDMDHIVVQGNQFLLVDSKNWRQDAHYVLAETLSDADVIYRDGQAFEGGHVHLRRQTIEWMQHIGRVDVKSALVIANRRSQITTLAHTGYEFINLSGLEAIFASVFRTEHPEPLSKEWLQYLCGMIYDASRGPNAQAVEPRQAGAAHGTLPRPGSITLASGEVTADEANAAHDRLAALLRKSSPQAAKSLNRTHSRLLGVLSGRRKYFDRSLLSVIALLATLALGLRGLYVAWDYCVTLGLQGGATSADWQSLRDVFLPFLALPVIFVLAVHFAIPFIRRRAWRVVVGSCALVVGVGLLAGSAFLERTLASNASGSPGITWIFALAGVSGLTHFIAEIVARKRV